MTDTGAIIPTNAADATIFRALTPDETQHRYRAAPITWAALCAALRNPPKVRFKNTALRDAAFAEDLAGALTGREPTCPVHVFVECRGNYLNAANVIRNHALVADYDDARVPMAHAVELFELAGIRAFFHSSASNGKPKPKGPAGPRWRAILPLDHPLESEDDYRKAANALYSFMAANGAAPGVPEINNRACVYFYGQLDGVAYETAETEGEPFDTVFCAQIATSPATAIGGNFPKASAGTALGAPYAVTPEGIAYGAALRLAGPALTAIDPTRYPRNADKSTHASSTESWLADMASAFAQGVPYEDWEAFCLSAPENDTPGELSRRWGDTRDKHARGKLTGGAHRLDELLTKAGIPLPYGMPLSQHLAIEAMPVVEQSETQTSGGTTDPPLAPKGRPAHYNHIANGFARTLGQDLRAAAEESSLAESVTDLTSRWFEAVLRAATAGDLRTAQAQSVAAAANTEAKKIEQELAQELAAVVRAPQARPLLHRLASLAAADWHAVPRGKLCAATAGAFAKPEAASTHDLGARSEIERKRIADAFTRAATSLRPLLESAMPAEAPPLAFSPEYEPTKPRICTDAEPDITIEALSAFAQDPNVYLFQGKLAVHAPSGTESAGNATLNPFASGAAIRGYTDQHMEVYRTQTDIEGQEIENRVILLPDQCAAVHAGGATHHGVKTLKALVTRPFISAAGASVATPGYDSGTHTLLSMATPHPEVLDRPTREQAQAAHDALVGLIGDHPWASPTDLANYMAVLYGIVARRFIAGASAAVPLPGLLISADEKNSGKSNLSNLLFNLYGGSRLNWAENIDSEEFQKDFDAAYNSPSGEVMLMNNVTNGAEIGGRVLANAIGECEIESRIRGTGRRFTTTNTYTFVINGNNVRLTEDLTNRFVVAHLRAPTRADRAKERTAGDITLRLTEPTFNAQVLAYARTVVLGWIAAGAPRAALTEDNIRGNFLTWARATGGILDMCGMKGFLENWSQAQEIDDTSPEKTQESILVLSLFDKFGAERFRSKAIVDAVAAGSGKAFGAEDTSDVDIRLYLNQPYRQDKRIPRDVAGWGKALGKLKGKPFVIYPGEGAPQRVQIVQHPPVNGYASWSVNVLETLDYEPPRGCAPIHPAMTLH